MGDRPRFQFGLGFCKMTFRATKTGPLGHSKWLSKLARTRAALANRGVGMTIPVCHNSGNVHDFPGLTWNLTRGATDRRAVPWPEGPEHPRFAPGILTSFFVVWAAFCAFFRKFAKVQFGLSSLLWVVTGFAVLLSIAKTFPEPFWIVTVPVVAILGAVIATFCVLVVALEVFVWSKNPNADANTSGSRVGALLRSRYFWITFFVAIPIALCLNIIPYRLTYRAYETDGLTVAGWPLRFWVCGGFVGVMRFDKLALFIDMLVAMAFAAATGIGFRNGVTSICRRARTLIRKVRTWPHEDDS